MAASSVTVFGRNGHFFVQKAIGADGSAAIDFDDEYIDEAGESLTPVKFTDVDGNACFAYKYKHPAADGSHDARYLIGAAYRDTQLGNQERVGYFKVHVPAKQDISLFHEVYGGGAEDGQLTHEDLVQASMPDEAHKFRIINSSPHGENLLLEIQNRAAAVCAQMIEAHETPLTSGHPDYAASIDAPMPEIMSSTPAAVEELWCPHIEADFDIDSAPTASAKMFQLTGDDMFNVHFKPIAAKLKKKKSSSSSSSSLTGAKAAKSKAKSMTSKKKKKSSSKKKTTKKSETQAKAKGRMDKELEEVRQKRRVTGGTDSTVRPQGAPKPKSALKGLAKEKAALRARGRALKKGAGKLTRQAGDAALTTAAAGVVATKSTVKGARKAATSVQQAGQRTAASASRAKKRAGELGRSARAVAGSAGKILGATAREAAVAAATAAATAGTQAIVEQSAAAIERRRQERAERRRLLQEQEDDDDEEVLENDEDEFGEEDADESRIGQEQVDDEDPLSVLLDGTDGSQTTFDQFGNEVKLDDQEEDDNDVSEDVDEAVSPVTTDNEEEQADEEEEEENGVVADTVQTAPQTVVVPPTTTAASAPTQPRQLLYDDLPEEQKAFFRRNADGTASLFVVVLDTDGDGFAEPQFDPALARFPPEHQLFSPDATTVFNRRGADGDGDGLLDEYDNDDDNDGIPDWNDTFHGRGGGLARDGIPGFDGIGDFDGDGRTDDVDAFVGANWRDFHDLKGPRGSYIAVDANGDVIPAEKKKKKKRGCGCKSSVIRVRKVGQEADDDDEEDADEVFDDADRDGDGVVEFTNGDDGRMRGGSGKALVFQVPAYSQRQMRPMLLYCPTCPSRPLLVDVNTSDAKKFISSLMAPLVIEATDSLL